MKQHLMRFMAQRYGSDELNLFLSIIALILFFIAVIISGIVGSLISIFALVLSLYGIFRMFSKNKQKRFSERMKFLQIKHNFSKAFARKKQRFSQRRTHKFYKCPDCKTTVRVPKGKGKIKITCPKCKTAFVRKS